MPTLTAGSVVMVHHVDQLPYTLHVEVTEVTGSDTFTGRIVGIFATEDGEITGGDILRLRGQERAFTRADIIR